MNERRAKISAGIFAASAILLLLVMLFFFGMSEIFVHKVPMVTFFDESIQGLSVGSEVKYRGVNIGTVRNISVNVEQKLIKVEMSVEPDRFFGGDENNGGFAQKEELFRRFMKKEIASGLRCRLEFVGITGMKYVALDYFAPAKQEFQKPAKYLLSNDTVFVPSVNSTFKDIAVAMTSALERLSRVRFEEISEETERVLRELGTILSDPSIKLTLERMGEVAGNLQHSTESFSRVFNEQRMEQLLTLMENDLRSIDKLVNKLNTAADDMKLKESSASLRDAADSVTDLKSELTNTLRRFNESLELSRQLLEQLNDDPAMLLRGRGRKRK